MNPLVSIIVPSYNHGSYLSNCIESCINQTYKNIEILIIDDNSTDNSKEILNKYAHNNKLKIFINDENKGLPINLNYVIKNHVKGTYIKIIASDDMLTSNCIEKLVNVAEDDVTFGIIYGRVKKIDNKNKIIGDMPFAKYSGYSFNKVFTKNYKVPTQSMLIRTSSIKEVGLFNPNILHEDIYILLKIAEKFKISYVNETIVYYRRHNNNTNKNIWKYYQETKKLIALFQNHNGYHKILNEYKLYWFNILAEKYKKQALKYFIPSLQYFYKKSFILGLFKLLK